MKILIFLFLLSCLATTSQAQNQLIVSDTLVKLTMDYNTTADDLLRYALRLKQEKGITFYIEHVEYDKLNKLKSIKFIVDCHDGFKGSAGGTFSANSKSSIGFYRNYVSLFSPFGTGKV